MSEREREPLGVIFIVLLLDEFLEIMLFISLLCYIYRLCLVPGKYKGKKKNAKENYFLMFGCPMKNIKENQI